MALRIFDKFSDYQNQEMSGKKRAKVDFKLLQSLIKIHVLVCVSEWAYASAQLVFKMEMKLGLPWLWVTGFVERVFASIRLPRNLHKIESARKKEIRKKGKLVFLKNDTTAFFRNFFCLHSECILQTCALARKILKLASFQLLNIFLCMFNWVETLKGRKKTTQH